MDVVFTLELHGLQAELGQVGYRLQRDMRWRLLGEGHDLFDVDFRTESAGDIISLSPASGSSVEIDAVIYRINPSSVRLGDSILERSSRCFRHDFPGIPSKEQLQSVLIASDGTADQALVLGVDCRFVLWDASFFEVALNDPSVIVRHDTFQAGDGRVGPNATEIEGHIDRLYSSSLEGWLFHLKDGWTQIHAGLLAGRGEQELILALENLRKNWHPQVERSCRERHS